MRHFFLLSLLVAVGCEAKVTLGGDDLPLGTFTCANIEKDACVGPADSFASTAPVVHVLYRTKTLPKQGEVYVIRWIGEDVGAAAPANTVIATLEEKVTDDPALATTYNVNTNLTRPTAGWPPGKYRVEIERAGAIETTARFTITP